MFKEVKNVKQIVVVVILLLIYCIFVIAFINHRHKNKYNDNSNNNTNTNQTKKTEANEINVIITPNTIIGIYNNTWRENKKLKYEDMTFDVYADQEYKNLKATYTDRWYIMDENRNFIDYDLESGFVAISSKYPSSFKNFTYDALDESDEAVIKEFLDSKAIMYNNESLIKNVVNYDVNADGIKDKVYILTNVFLDDYTGFNKTFSYVFVRTLNQNILIYEDVNDNINALNMCYPKLKGVLSYKDDNIVLFECSYISNSGAKHILYKIQDKGFGILLETKSN